MKNKMMQTYRALVNIKNKQTKNKTRKQIASNKSRSCDFDGGVWNTNYLVVDQVSEISRQIKCQIKFGCKRYNLGANS